MSSFISGHATHPDWRMALAMAAAQVDAQRVQHEAAGAGPLTLGFVYFTDAYAAEAAGLLAALRQRWPGASWVGCAGVGVAASGVEYIDEPALVLLLTDLPRGRFEVFSGARPLRTIDAFSALVHADASTPDLGELVSEMSDRTRSGYLFGGLASSRSAAVHVADGVWQGGLSGVAFTDDVALVSRVTQGCQPVGPVRTVTQAERNIVIELDGEPALPCLLRDLQLPGLDEPRAALPKLRSTLVGLSGATGTSGMQGRFGTPDAALSRGGQFGADVRVRHLIGLDPARQAVAVAEMLEPGMRLAFCSRDVQAARRDLVRACSEIRDEVETAAETAQATSAGTAAAPGAASAGPPQRAIRGAIYISCAGRGGPHFGGPSAELRIVQHALGDVPLVGFFASGEIARGSVYSYTGVLTVFTGAAG